jgi:ATP-dependent RNA helicase SUPV3L1/SUV3
MPLATQKAGPCALCALRTQSRQYSSGLWNSRGFYNHNAEGLAKEQIARRVEVRFWHVSLVLCHLLICNPKGFIDIRRAAHTKSGRTRPLSPPRDIRGHKVDKSKERLPGARRDYSLDVIAESQSQPLNNDGRRENLSKSRAENTTRSPYTSKRIRGLPSPRLRPRGLKNSQVTLNIGDFSTNNELLTRLFLSTFDDLGHALNKSPRKLLGWGVTDKEEHHSWHEKFRQRLQIGCKLAEVRKQTQGTSGKPKLDAEEQAGIKLFDHLRDSFMKKTIKGLVQELEYSFGQYIVGSRFSAEDNKSQAKLADLRFPSEWYPATRALQRHIHLHVGPTNSGKTYHALKRLEESESGIYAGPLRLLAHEVYTRLNAKDIPCSLITGEERRYPDGKVPTMSSCTVEMVPLNRTVDVAVIDEIQMIGDSERGWAWTQAFLGVKAKEVHLCGELRTVPLIEELCRSVGDKLTIHNYERLSPLETMDKGLGGNLQNLQKGDCIILFSRLGIHAMKKEVERATGKRCAVVYGSLPPEVRAQQAALFNDPNNDYDFLAASDAVGMGLNLSIKRIIFEATTRFNGYTHAQIGISDVKQIGGRAGRYRTADQAAKSNSASNSTIDPTDGMQARSESKSLGLVTTLEDADLPVVAAAMKADAEPLKTAGIFPPANILTRFAAYFPKNTPFSHILMRLHEISKTNPSFHICNLRDQLAIADVIQPYNLTIQDRLCFIAAPAPTYDFGLSAVTAAYARCIANNTGGELLDIPELDLEALDLPESPDFGSGSVANKRMRLQRLEALHKAIALYLWLSYRFSGTFRSQALAFHVKSLVEEKIDAALSEFQGSSRLQRKYQKAARAAKAKTAI